MLHSMTGFGRCFLEDTSCSQVWEIRSVNGKYLDIRWRLPQQARPFEAILEKIVKKHAARGRVEISLTLTMTEPSFDSCFFNEPQANAMLDEIESFAQSRGETFTADYNRLLGLSFLWQDANQEPDEQLQASLEKGLTLALDDWNESRTVEAKALETDINARLVRIAEWVARIQERAPDIKEERFATVQDRINDLLERFETEVDESRFLQEIAILSDKLDVSEELTRLGAHLDRMSELLASGADAGRKLDFILQECFREVTTCGNKIQDLQVSRLIVDLKNELEKCREQVQNLE